MAKRKSAKDKNMDTLMESLKADMEDAKVDPPTEETTKEAKSDPPVTKAPEPVAESKKPITLAKAPPAPTHKTVMGLVQKDRLSLGKADIAVVPGKVDTYPISLADNLIAMGLVREV